MTKNYHVGIIMNGVTGRMGTNQHLLRSLVPIIEEGGLLSEDGENRIIPKLILVGRNEEKLKNLVEQAPGAKWTTSLTNCCGFLPKARSSLLFVPKRLVITGKDEFFTLVKSSAGPPPAITLL